MLKAFYHLYYVICVLSDVLFVENKYYVQTIGCSGRNILTFISSMERNKDI